MGSSQNWRLDCKGPLFTTQGCGLLSNNRMRQCLINMCLLVFIVCLSSSACATQLRRYGGPHLRTATDISYEVIRLLHRHPRSLMYGGCRQIMQRVPDMAKEPVQVTILCPDEDCIGTDFASKPYSLPAHGDGHLSFACGLNANRPGSRTSMITNAIAEAVQHGDGLFMLDTEACPAGKCSGIETLQWMDWAASEGFVTFTSIDWTRRRMTTVAMQPLPYGHRMASGSNIRIQTYAEAGSQGAVHAFNHVYSQQLWGPNGQGSGWGSDMEFTEPLRAMLLPLLQKYGIKSMVDAPCGSFHWMPSVLELMPADFQYTGLDVVCSLVEGHRKAHLARPNWRFYCADVCHQGLPRADLVFSRDALQHVPLSYATSFLERVKASGAKYLLVGSYDEGNSNQNIEPGAGAYRINLRKAPFNVTPAPLEVLDEGEGRDGKFMLLYEVASMAWSPVH